MKHKPVIDPSFVYDGLLFVTHRARCLYIGKATSEKARWLKENEDKFIRIDDIEQESAQPGPPVGNQNDFEATPTGPTSETSLRDVRNYSPLYQPALAPASANEETPTGSTPTQLEPLSRAEAAMSETTKTKAGITPLGGMGSRGDVRRPKTRDLPARTSKSARKLTPEVARIIFYSLREVPILWQAARRVGIHRKSLENWIKASKAGDDGYDFEWRGEMLRFHKHCETAIDEAFDQLIAIAHKIGMSGVGRSNSKMIRYCLELARREKWGKNTKIDIPRTGGVLVIGGSTEKRENNSAASIRARKWKSYSRKIREAMGELS